jgi:HAD superfamily hydrolase (TIGR01509 family)
MDHPWVIFDMDGTLIDSMHYWRNIGREYLERKGVTGDHEELLERVQRMTMLESATCFRDTFDLPGTPMQIVAEMEEMIAMHYLTDIPLKPGAAEYLRKLREDDIWLCIATATPEPLARACLERLGVADCFAFILSCDDVNASKERPDIFLECAWRLGAEPEDIAVFEDAYYAARTAKMVGFYVIGVYDDDGARHWKDMERICDETIRSWDELL